MGHKADKSFFHRKKAWSKRKDVILSYYLTPYLAKVRSLGRPVLLVDGFAGPGKFDDGEIGSPLLLCAKAQAANKRPGPPVRVLCIEANQGLFDNLDHNVGGFDFATARHGEFLTFVDQIRDEAREHTVLLYLDPYRAADIDWAALERVSQMIQSAGSSVELLMNFNTPSFVRWGLAALARKVPDADPAVEDPEAIDAEVVEAPADDRLTKIVGGTWWRDVLGQKLPFDVVIKQIADGLGTKLKTRFAEVCWLGVKQDRLHRVPKYHMFFGSRHSDALELMNEAMVKARGVSDFQIDLFAKDDLKELLLKGAKEWIPRKQLMLAVVRQAFCMYYWKDIRGSVEQLLKDGHLVSETGKPRINDKTLVKRVEELPGF